MDIRYGGMKYPVMTMGGESPPRHLSRQIAGSAKGCPKRTEPMYRNTTVAHGERGGAVDKVVFSDIKKQPVVFTRPICKDLAV